VPTAETARLLNAYLDTVGFHGIYKFVTSFLCYFATPHMAHGRQRGQFERFDEFIGGQGPGLDLLKCLMTCREVDVDSLTQEERGIADALIDEGMLRLEGRSLRGGRYQLISYLDTYLFIDARINFPQFGRNETYIGGDTYLMLYYLGTERIGRHDRALDICTGTCIGALALSRFSDHVVAVDIDDAALALAGFNLMLNGKDQVVDLRKEDLRDTLEGNDRYDAITCNPPYVPVPPGLNMSLFAAGPGPDGLDYLRMLFAQAGRILTDSGSAYYVAVLGGDDEQPYFFREAEDYCSSDGLTVDAYLDGGLPVDRQIKFLAPAVHEQNTPLSEELATAALSDLLVGRLAIKRFYCCTMRVRRNAATPGLRVFNRNRPEDPSSIPATEWLRVDENRRE